MEYDERESSRPSYREVRAVGGLLGFFAFLIVMGILSCWADSFLIGIILILIGATFFVICGWAFKNRWSRPGEETAAERERLFSHSWISGVIVFLTACLILIAVYVLIPSPSPIDEPKVVSTVVLVGLFVYWVYGKIKWQREQQQKAPNI
jgi:hypothetical protein